MSSQKEKGGGWRGFRKVDERDAHLQSRWHMYPRFGWPRNATPHPPPARGYTARRPESRGSARNCPEKVRFVRGQVKYRGGWW